MYKALASTTVSGTVTNTITFSSIPQTHKSLLLYVHGGENRSGVTASPMIFTINSLGYNNFYQTYVYRLSNGNSQGFLVGDAPEGQVLAGNLTNGNFGAGLYWFPNYTVSGVEKMGYNYGGVGGYTSNTGQIGQMAWWNNNTAPISQLVLTTRTNANFKAGTSAILYGIS
jgi:hypothetical protein